MSTDENRAGAVGQRNSFVARLAALPARLLTAARRNLVLAALLLCGTAIILSSAGSIIYYLATRGPASDAGVTIEAALELLDAGEHEQAKLMAIRLRDKIGDDYRRLGHPLFVQGAALASEASQLSHEAERQALYLLAARYLEEARDRGFPDGREKQGLYLLATCLFNSGNYAESLPALHEALAAIPRQQYELHRLLSTAYLHDIPPDLNKALQHNRLWLEDPSLTAAARDQADVQQSEILLGLGDTAACQTVLGKIGEDSPVHDQALVMLARLLIEEGDRLLSGAGDAGDAESEAKEKYRRASGALGRAQSKDYVGNTTQQSRYLLGVCHQKLGDLRAASQAYEHTARMHYRTAEALAANLADAEIAQEEGRGDIALNMYLKVIEDAGDSSRYQNPWVSLNVLRRRLGTAQEHFQAAGDFESAIEMATEFEKIFPPDVFTLALAETREAWAEHLLSLAAEPGTADAEVTRAEARRQFRLAAKRYRQLAQLRFATREYPNDLWKSGHCFLRGQNYELAIELLRDYLDNVPRKQHPQGLVGLGESHLALGHFHQAVQVLDECIQFYPKHPESYRARILASAAYEELGQLKDAQALLSDNLHNSSLTPRSVPWQDSLFAYGKLLFKEAMMREAASRENGVDSSDLTKRQTGLKDLQAAHDLFRLAIDSLGEAVERYPDSPEAIEARYYIAESYRHSAKAPKKSWDIEPTQTRRTTLQQQMRDYLVAAADAHRELQELLVNKHEQMQLTPVEQVILRNTYFGYADAIYDLGDYDQAINAYSTATKYYQFEPEALEALIQIVNCYRHLNAFAEARGTLLQAQAFLTRIRQDADFTKTTRYDRKQWEGLIGWLSQL